MKIGTKSVLFGVHQFLLHPLLIALGWWKAYGFDRVWIGRRAAGGADKNGSAGRDVFASLLSPRLWLAFAVHDIGYLGKSNMDGPEGETHPEVGAAVMRAVCGEPWGDFVLLHSRYYAQRLGRPLSPLCIADKWVILLEPAWLYLPRARASGELAEFLDMGQRRAAQADVPMTEEERTAFLRREPHVWHRTLKAHIRRWILEHRDGRADTWTKARPGSRFHPS